MVPSVFVEKHDRMIQLKATKEEYLTNLRAMAAESEMHRKTLAEEEEVRVTVGLILKLISFTLILQASAHEEFEVIAAGTEERSTHVRFSEIVESSTAS